MFVYLSQLIQFKQQIFWNILSLNSMYPATLVNFASNLTGLFFGPCHVILSIIKKNDRETKWKPEMKQSVTKLVKIATSEIMYV